MVLALLILKQNIMQKDIPEQIELTKSNNVFMVHEPEEDYIVANAKEGSCEIKFYYTTGGADYYPVTENKGLSKGLHNVSKVQFIRKDEDCILNCETGFLEDTIKENEKSKIN